MLLTALLLSTLSIAPDFGEVPAHRVSAQPAAVVPPTSKVVPMADPEVPAAALPPFPSETQAPSVAPADAPLAWEASSTVQVRPERPSLLPKSLRYTFRGIAGAGGVVAGAAAVTLIGMFVYGTVELMRAIFSWRTYRGMSEGEKRDFRTVGEISLISLAVGASVGALFGAASSL